MLTAACMNQNRRMIPGQPGQEPQQDLQLEDPDQRQQGQQMGQEGNTAPQISATYEKADVEFITTANNVTARRNPSANSPAAFTIPAGTKVKVVAKYDGWYVAYHNNRLGFIPMASARVGSPAASQPVPDVPGSAGSSPTNEESEMLSLINSERSKAGLKPLSANAEVTKLARLKSKDIAEKNYFSHVSPTYGSPFEMLKSYGVSYLYAGENLAKNQSVQAAHQALMNSPGHKKNILGANFTEVGIGVITDQGNTKVYTQIFIGK